MAHERPEAEKRFEITLPEGHSLEARVALQAMVHAFNWRMEDVTQDKREISWPSMHEASERIFGSERYAVFAHDIVRHLQAGAVASVTDTSCYAGMNNLFEARYVAEFSNSYFHLGPVPVDTHPDTDTTPQALKKKIAQGGEYKRPIELPFDLYAARGDFSDKIYGFEVLKIKPGDISIDGLAKFLRSMGWDRHRYSGTLGKAIDLMAIQAGLKDDSELAHDSGETFIDMEQLESEAALAGIKPSTRRNMLQRINNALIGQIIGQDYTAPFVVEGACRLYTGHNGVSVERVSLSSLGVLADKYQGPSPAISFLRSYAPPVTESIDLE